MLVKAHQSSPLKDNQCRQIGRAGHVTELENRPAEAVGLAPHDGQGAHALHGEDKENQDRNNVAKSFTIEDDFSKTLSDVTGTCVHSAKPPRRGKPTKRTSTRKPFGKL